MTTELTRVRFRELSKAIRKVNTVDGITNAEIAEVNNTRALVFVKKGSVQEFYNTLENKGIYPLIIDIGSIYTLSIKLNEVDQPLFVEVEL